MNRKIPQDAFGFYWSMGPERSHQALAEKYGVSKRAVTKLAIKENWKSRIMEIEKKAQDATDQKIAETLEQMNERHIKVCKLIQRKALEALKTMPLGTAIEAVRSLESSIKTERLVRGEPTDRSALAVEDVIRKEYERWLGDDRDTEEEVDKPDAEEQADQ